MSNLERLREILRQQKGSAQRDSGPQESLDPSAGSRTRELSYEPLDRSGLPAIGARHALSEDEGRHGTLLDFAGASVIETSTGPCVVVEHCFDADAMYGRSSVRDFEFVDETALAVLGRWQSEDGNAASKIRRPVFFDLETTGLSGGAGTIAFLVGCGFFDEGVFRTRQYFLTSFAAERALLEAVSEFLTSADCLVTYNGKTFDVPVMETRWLYQRMTPTLPESHLDMLHPARRLWRRLGEEESDRSCRLTALERVLLGVWRQGDVSGWEIPARYFAYVREGNVAALEPVLLHNRYDLLSLAGLTARALRLVRDGTAALADPSEWLAVARIYEHAGLLARAEACYRDVIDASPTLTVQRIDALRHLARLRRRDRRYVEAADAWHALLQLEPIPDSVAAFEAKEALAIHEEHRRRDLDAARQWAHELLNCENPRRISEALYRLARLDRKLSVREKGDLTVAPLFAFLEN